MSQQELETEDTGLSTDFEIDVNTGEEARAAQAYALGNPGTLVGQDYGSALVSRGATECREDDQGFSRLTGGATVYPDENAYALLQSGGCFQDFRRSISEAVEIPGENVYLGNKDLFLETGEDTRDLKIVGFGARVGLDGPNLYGAFWREEPHTDASLRNIQEDGAEEPEPRVEELSKPLTDNSLWEEVVEDEHNRPPEEALREADPERYDVESLRQARGCVAAYGPEDSKPAVNWPPGKQDPGSQL